MRHRSYSLRIWAMDLRYSIFRGMVFRSECVYIYNPFVVGMILLEMGVGCLFFFQGFYSISGTSFEFFFRLVPWSTRY